jgi:hypothetical protein
MGRVRAFLKEPGLHVLLLGLFGFVLSWPFMKMPAMVSPHAEFIYLFGSWSVLILVLLLLSRVM